MYRFAFATAAILAASMALGCTSSDDADSANGGNGAPPSTGTPGSETKTPEKPACTASAPAPVPALENSALIDVAADAKGPLFLIRPPNTTSALHLVRADGEKKVLAEADGTTGALATRPDGVVCAAWGVKAPSARVYYACGPNFDVVDTKVELEVNRDGPLAFSEDANTSALLFMGKFNSLDGAFRDGATWSDANVNESSISYAGSTRALGGAKEGSPFCWLTGGKVATVESWRRGGSANRWGYLKLEDKIASCSLAISGTTLGVFAIGGGKAKLATAPITGQFASPLVEEGFDASDITTASFVADKNEFAVLYGTSTGATRAVRKASRVWESTPIEVPPGSVSTVALARENGREHIVVKPAAGGSTFYQRSCPSN